MPRLLLLCSVLSWATTACDPTEVAKQCVAADLVAQCPAGSNPVLGAVANTACGGEFNSNLVTDGASASGQCNSSGSCQFLCQFETPCSCGVATLTKDAIVCSECPDQSCGDGRCEGTERPSCEPGQPGCQPCAEDCTGPTCGDGDCTGDEDPATCPQDCADLCTPDASVCVGTKVSKCAADGRTSVEFDCASVGQVCGAGACAPAGVCGNALCEAGESAASCAVDCSTLCQPSSRACDGATLTICAADGRSQSQVDCGASGQICIAGQCKPANVCGNGACEAGESQSCAQDCAAVCGNDVCENNEATACPEDCTTCGNHTCEAGETERCPQDCGICTPSEKQCLGPLLRVCNANGTAYDDIACADFGLVCAAGDCVEPDVCGNGACETGESIATCAADCTEVCGDGDCGGAESFRTCAADCEPVCGDGTCEGLEDDASCSFDCLASCGDGACVAPEDRVNCPGDCGFCGDGACQDGYESASLNPPAGLESCVVDCVVSQCGEDSDCDDDVACTANQCRNGACIYTPDDDLCSGTDKCIRLNGCCPDGDGDGYADSACGGSDCNDRDPDVHPGALEVCGGGDMNCNGQHKPALLPAKKLTSSPSFKRELTVLEAGEGLVLAWTGKPATTQHLEMLDVGWDLLPDGAVKVVDEIEVNEVMPRVAIAYNPTRGKLGVWWVEADVFATDGYGPGWQARAGWMDLDGAFEGDPAIIAPDRPCTTNLSPRLTRYATAGIARGDTIVFPTERFGYNGGYPNLPPNDVQGGPFYELTGTGNVAATWGGGDCKRLDDTMTRPFFLNGLLTGLQFRNLSRTINNISPRVDPPTWADVATLDPSGTDYSEVAQLAHPSRQGDCAAGDDGELMAIACQKDDKVYYHRATQAGGAFYSDTVIEGAQVPIAVGKSKPHGGDSPTVGVALSDASGNLWFFVRDAAGEEVLAPAIIGGGDKIASAWVMHDGNDFVVVWLAQVGGFEQAFGQRVTCE